MVAPNFSGYSDTKEQAKARIAKRETRYVNEQIKAYEVPEQPVTDWRNPEFLSMLVNFCNTDPAHIRTASERAELEAQDADYSDLKATQESTIRDGVSSAAWWEGIKEVKL